MNQKTGQDRINTRTVKYCPLTIFGQYFPLGEAPQAVPRECCGPGTRFLAIVPVGQYRPISYVADQGRTRNNFRILEKYIGNGVAHFRGAKIGMVTGLFSGQSWVRIVLL